MECFRTSRPSPASSTLAVGWCSTADARWRRSACSSPSLSSHQPLILQERCPSELSGLACATVMRRCANAALGQAATAAAQRMGGAHVKPRHEAEAVQRSIEAAVLRTKGRGSRSLISRWCRGRAGGIRALRHPHTTIAFITSVSYVRASQSPGHTAANAGHVCGQVK